MGNVSNEMPTVSKCDIRNCAYNVNSGCHAKAITVGDHMNPGCDTFFDREFHTLENKRIAGVGACKVTDCKYNEDLECSATNIAVGMKNKKINCLTFSHK